MSAPIVSLNLTSKILCVHLNKRVMCTVVMQEVTLKNHVDWDFVCRPFSQVSRQEVYNSDSHRNHLSQQESILLINVDQILNFRSKQ